MTLKRDKVDKVFSDLIRIRDDWTCQKCRKVYPEGRRQGLHCSHIFSRRHQATRFFSLNAKALCFSCHQWYGGNPVESAEWINTYLGDNALRELRERKNKVCKRTKKDKEALYQHLKAQKAYLEKRKAEGKEAVIVDFQEWWE